MAAPGPLVGVRVVDCSAGHAGPLAAMWLADLGADVAKPGPLAVEALGVPGESIDEGWAGVVDRGKRHLADHGGAERALAALQAADVCVVSGSLDRVRDAPIEPARLARSYPRLVVLHVAPYTDRAPWAGGQESDPLLAAITGVPLRQHSASGSPIESICPHLLTVQGMWAAAAAIAALVERERSGRGQIVTVAGIHAVLIAGAGGLTFDGAVVAGPAGTPRAGGAGGPVPFYRTYRCGDGEWLFLAALTPRFSAIAFATLGVESLLDDPRLAGGGRAAMLLPENAVWVIEAIGAVFAGAPRAEWLRRLADAGCPAGPVLARDDWLDHPQVRAIGMRTEVDDPVRGRVVMPGLPLVFRDACQQVDRSAPPPPPPAELAATPSGRSAVAPGGGPLSGYRVVDLGAVIAGPFAGSLLAELGADVVKVEPLEGDSFRGPGFAAYNKGQRSVALDLRTERGRAALLALVKSADVVIDNYRPGVLERLRLRPADLAAVRPDIITLSVTGFGEGGPLGSEPGFDPVLQAMSGMMAAEGGAGDPVFSTIPVNDVAAAVTAALAACVGLLHRLRCGCDGGRRAWTSLAGMSAALQAGALAQWHGRPEACCGANEFQGPSTTDRFARVADGWVRFRGVPADTGVIGAVQSMSRSEAVRSLTDASVPAVALHTANELVEDRDLAGFGVFAPDPRPGRGSWWTPARHARFSRTERTGVLVAPALGHHTRPVLEQAGLTPDEIRALIEDGIAVG